EGGYWELFSQPLEALEKHLASKTAQGASLATLSRLSAANVRIVAVAALLVGFGLVGLGMVLEEYKLLSTRALVLDRARHWSDRRNDANAPIQLRLSVMSLERGLGSVLLFAASRAVDG